MNLNTEEVVDKRIQLLSSDRYGLELDVDIITKNFRIDLRIHQKRSRYASLEITDDANDKTVYYQDLTFTYNSPVLNNVLNLCPQVVSDLVYNFSNKWHNLSYYAAELIKEHKENTYISIIIFKNKDKQLFFNHKKMLEHVTI